MKSTREKNRTLKEYLEVEKKRPNQHNEIINPELFFPASSQKQLYGDMILITEKNPLENVRILLEKVVAVTSLFLTHLEVNFVVEGPVPWNAKMVTSCK